MQKELLKKLKSLWADRRPYTKRLLYAGAAVLAACFTFIFFGPLEMVAFGGDSFFYNYTDVLPMLSLTAVIVFVAGTLLVALLRGKIFNYALCIITSLTVCGYLQAALMNGSLGTQTGETVEWTSLKTEMALNLLIWAAVLAVFLLIMYLHRKLWRTLVMIVSLALVIMQAAPTVGILTGAYDGTKITAMSDYFLSEDGMYEYSENKNTFVFVLDYTDYDYIEQVLEKDPDFFNGMDGFTGYTDAISVFGRTQPALNNLMTGCTDLQYNVPASEFYTDSWTQDGKNILQQLKDCNYDIEMYANIGYLFGDPEYADEYVSNVYYTKEGVEYTESNLVKKLLSLSVYRYAPTAVKPFFWADTNYYNEGVYALSDVTRYIINDSKYASGFLNATADRQKNSFKLYHFFGAHPPYSLNSDGTRSSETTDAATQTMGVFSNLFGAFEQMKQLGIYEDATIIITADHGNAGKMVGEEMEPVRIAMFYKPAGNSEQPFTWSSAQVSNANVAATVLKAAGADYGDYGTPLDDITEDTDVSRVFYRTVLSQSSWADTAVQKYEVTGDSTEISNWKLLDTYKVKYRFYG